MCVREDHIVKALDGWLGRLFDPDHRDDTVDALLATNTAPDPRRQHAIDLATQAIAACDRRLDQYRAALDQGADPTTVTGWITETAAERAKAQAQLDATRREHREPDRADIELYAALRLKLTLHPAKHLVSVESKLQAPRGRNTCRRGDSTPKHTAPRRDLPEA